MNLIVKVDLDKVASFLSEQGDIIEEVSNLFAQVVDMLDEQGIDGMGQRYLRNNDDKIVGECVLQKNKIKWFQ